MLGCSTGGSAHASPAEHPEALTLLTCYFKQAPYGVQRSRLPLGAEAAETQFFAAGLSRAWRRSFVLQREVAQFRIGGEGRGQLGMEQELVAVTPRSGRSLPRPVAP